MRFTPDNFLRLTKDIVTGSDGSATTNGVQGADGGYLVDYPIALGDVAPATSSTTLTTDAAGLHVLKAQHTTTSIGTAGFVVPRDYDQNTDKLILRITAAMSGNTNTPVLSVTSSTQSVTSTGSTYGPLVAGLVGSTTALSSTMSIYEVNLSGQGLTRDEIVSLVLAAAAHTTDDVLIYNLDVVYASCLVAFLDATNVAGKAFGYDALGNPLR